MFWANIFTANKLDTSTRNCLMVFILPRLHPLATTSRDFTGQLAWEPLFRIFETCRISNASVSVKECLNDGGACWFR